MVTESVKAESCVFAFHENPVVQMANVVNGRSERVHAKRSGCDALRKYSVLCLPEISYCASSVLFFVGGGGAISILTTTNPCINCG